MARNKLHPDLPRYTDLIIPTFCALKALGGSGKNNEILNQIIVDLKIPDELVDIPHKGSESKSELSYQADWARTYLRIFGIIENSARGVWAIKPGYANCNPEDLNLKEIIQTVSESSSSNNKNSKKENNKVVEDDDPTNDGVVFPQEDKPWRDRLFEVLKKMDPYAFERLSQRLLRECGFTEVKVTKKSGDGGIDGTGKLKINGIFSFNVAFQCKRYSGSVGAPEIRDFRGSLTTDIEKGVLITTGTFSKQAIEEASNPGKKQIDLIDGEEFINKIAEYGIGVKQIISYEIDEEYFRKI